MPLWFAPWVWLVTASVSTPSPCAPCIESWEASFSPQPSTAATVGWFFGGAATGFLAHEAAHVLANFAFDNRPDIVGVKGFGFVPFFAISPDIDCDADGCTTRSGAPFAAGWRGKYIISTAGFIAGDIASETILSSEPCLRYKRAPYRTGWLAFNILLSVGYALSTATGVEVDHGDAGGAAAAAALDRRVFAAMLLTPALVNAYRFFWPGSAWAPWVARAGEAAMVGVVIPF